MEVNFVNKTRDKQYRSYKDDFKIILEKTMKHLNLDLDAEIAVIMVKDRYIRNINRDYRNIDKVTDVISFANVDDIGYLTDELGDVFINVNRAITQAQDYGHSLRHEINFLFLHGLLHCLGYDHMTKEDEDIMFPLQREIMKQLDYLDD